MASVHFNTTAGSCYMRRTTNVPSPSSGFTAVLFVNIFGYSDYRTFFSLEGAANTYFFLESTSAGDIYIITRNGPAQPPQSTTLWSDSRTGWRAIGIRSDGTNAKAAHMAMGGASLTEVSHAYNNSGPVVTSLAFAAYPQLFPADADGIHAYGAIKVFSRVLSDMELLAEMRQRRPVSWSGLTFFNECLDPAVIGTDQSGTGGNCTVTGSGDLSASANDPGVPLRAARLAVFLAASGGAVETPMEISGAMSQTPSVSRAAARTISATLAQAASRLRALTRVALSATLTKTPTRARAVGRSLASEIDQTTGAAPVQTGIGLSLSATQPQSPSRARQVGAVKTTSAAQSAARTREIRRPIASGINGSPSLVSGQQYTRDLNTTQTQTPARTRSLGLVRAGTLAEAPSRERALGKTAAAGQTQTPAAPTRTVGRVLAAGLEQLGSRVRAVGRTIAGSSSLSPSVEPEQGGPGETPMTISAAITQSAVVSRALLRALATGVAETPSRTRALTGVAKTATQTQTPSVVSGFAYIVMLSAAIAQTPVRAMALGLVRLVTFAQGLVLQRALGLTRASSQTQAPTRAREVSKAGAAGVTQSPAVTSGSQSIVTIAVGLAMAPFRALGMGLTRAATQNQTGATGRVLGLLRSVAQLLTPTRQRALSRTIATSSAQAPSETQQQGDTSEMQLSGTLTQTPSVTQATTQYVHAPNEDTVFVRPDNDTIKVR
jgi:hypothetical protein